MFGPWTVRAPDSVAALTAFLQQRDSAWRAERPDSTDLVFDLYRVDFYRGGDLVATLTARDTHLGIEGEFGKFEQSISVDEFARLNALLGVGVEVVPVPPRESSR